MYEWMWLIFAKSLFSFLQMESPAAAGKAVVIGSSKRESELEQELQHAHARVACVMHVYCVCCVSDVHACIAVKWSPSYQCMLTVVSFNLEVNRNQVQNCYIIEIQQNCIIAVQTHTHSRSILHAQIHLELSYGYTYFGISSFDILYSKKFIFFAMYFAS